MIENQRLSRKPVMETSNIPGTFWHAPSICMIVATLGLVFIAYRSSSVSIEIADAKISLNSALSTAKDIRSDLEKENESLKAANQALKAKLAESGTTKKPEFGAEFGKLLKEKAPAEQLYAYKPIDPKKFEELDTKIKQVEKTLKE
ncbi:MAG TPA: hypothetical protein PLK99_11425 [Burkholderiales bacterium]|nr:hypothetical protein [Burkholderiales bacterium]